MRSHIAADAPVSVSAAWAFITAALIAVLLTAALIVAQPFAEEWR
jgi:hypothetical protein